jgi:hypothetical protein
MEKKMASWVTGDERSAIVRPISASRWGCGVWSASRCGGDGGFIQEVCGSTSIAVDNCAYTQDSLLLAPHSNRWVGRGRPCDANTVAQANVKERLAQDEEDLGYIEPSRKSCISWVKTVVV